MDNSSSNGYENNSLETLETQVLNQIPVLHVKGTNFEIGYTIGRTFKNLIHDHLNKCDFFPNLLEAYSTIEGKNIYDNCLGLCKAKYPLLIDELNGIAKGSETPFHKLFLLHIDTLIVPPKQTEELHELKGSGDNGCSDLLTFDSKKKLLLLGHTEDVSKAMKNNLFIIVAQVYDQNRTTKLEHYAAITYAGYLPGATMGFNVHGVFNTNNTLVPSQTLPSKTPILFMNRALLGAVNLEEAIQIIKDHPDGASDGFNLNLIYCPPDMKTIPIVQSIEVAPNLAPGSFETVMNIQNVEDGSSYAHCNKYLRMEITETSGRTISSENRLKVIQSYSKNKPVYDLEAMKAILSDKSNDEYPLFRNGTGKDSGVTGAVGIFDVLNRKWFIYKERPISADPILVIPLDL